MNRDDSSRRIRRPVRRRGGQRRLPFGPESHQSVLPAQNAAVEMFENTPAEFARRIGPRSSRHHTADVFGDIALGAREPVQPLEDRFRIPELPLALRAYWHHSSLEALNGPAVRAAGDTPASCSRRSDRSDAVFG